MWYLIAGNFVEEHILSLYKPLNGSHSLKGIVQLHMNELSNTEKGFYYVAVDEQHINVSK